MKQEEKLQVLNQELNDLIETKKKIKKQELLDSQREKLFKKIYVTITDDEINKFLKNYNSQGYSTKDEIVNAITDFEFSKNLKKGNDFFSKKDYKNALTYYNLALSECKTDIVWFLKANCHMILKEYDDALISLKKSLDINPNSNYAIYLILEIYLIQEKFDEGIKYCNRLLKVHRNNFLIWHCKGKLLSGKHNFQEALQYLDKALDLKPDDAMSWHIKSICYTNLNQLDEAIKCNKKALSLNSNNEEFIKISKILEERKNA